MQQEHYKGKMVEVGVNGFGHIGHLVTRAAILWQSPSGGHQRSLLSASLIVFKPLKFTHIFILLAIIFKEKRFH